MKKLILLLAVLSFMACNKEQRKGNEKEKQHHKTENKMKLRHVVLFSFKESSSAEDIGKVVDAFKHLPDQIQEIKGFEYGTNNSPEGLNQGLTHCFLLTFDSEEGRDAYLPHPAHKAFGEVATPHIDKVTVLDYWAKK